MFLYKEKEYCPKCVWGKEEMRMTVVFVEHHTAALKFNVGKGPGRVALNALDQGLGNLKL